MPKTAEKKKSQRGPIPEQETFRYSTPDIKVASRPVDAFVAPEPAKPSPLGQVLNDLQQAGYYWQMGKQIQRKEDARAGQIKALKGEQLPGDASLAMIRAYEETQGTAAVSEYQVAAEQYFQENWTKPRGEFEAGLHELGSAAINGRSDNFILGFLPKALEIEEKVKRNYIKAQQADLQDNYTTNLKQSIRVQLDRPLSPKDIRELLSSYQQQAALFNLSRSQVTELFVDTLGEMAVQNGAPELMLFVDEADESGIKVTDTPYGTKAIDYMKKAENVRDTAIKQAETAAQKAVDAAVEQAANRFTTRIALLDPGSPTFLQDAAQVQKDLIAVGESQFKEGRYSTLMKWIDDLVEKGRFREYSIPEAYNAANSLAENGFFDGNAQAFFGPSLSRSDLTRLQDKNQNALKEQGNRAYTRYTENRKKYESFVADRAGAPMTMVEGMLPGQASKALERRMNATTLYNSIIEDLEEKAQKEGRYPTTEEVIRAADTVIEHFKKTGPEETTDKSTGNSNTNSVLDRLRNLSKPQQESKIVGGFDISSYATDPNHEASVAKIAASAPPELDVSKITSYIQSVAPDSPITGEMVVNSAKKFDVDHKVLLALMQQDSAFGTKGKGSRTHNPGNVGNDDTGREVDYGSWEAGVDAVAGWLSRNRS